MSSTPPNASTNNNNSSSTLRANYSDHVTDVPDSQKTTRKLATGIGHHINNPLHNPFPNQQNQPTQQSGMPQYGGGSEKCARCLKTVYAAEKKIGAGRSFHISCFSCHTCNKKLDAPTLSEHKGEIYCKGCYTKQFGAHGLISGVSMSTEIPLTRDYHQSHRSSFSGDLDKPVMTEQQPRQRLHSSDNVLRDRYSGPQNNEFSQKYPRQNDVIPEPHSPLKNKNNGINAIVGKRTERSFSPTGFDSSFESTKNDNIHRSTYVGEVDRSAYLPKGAQLSRGSGASAIVDIPVVSHSKRSDITINRIETSGNSIRETQRSRSPSISSTDSYRRQNSRDRPSDLADDYIRMNINGFDDKRNNQQHSTNNAMSSIASENPLAARTFYHSSPTSSFENKYQNSTSNPYNYDREQHHSRGSSPSVTGSRNRSPSPASGYISSSSSATRTSSNTYGVGALRDATSSFIPQHDNINTRTSPTNLNNRRSSSPQHADRTSHGVNDFIRKTTLPEHVSPSGGDKFSALSGLVNIPRQQYDDFLD